VVAYVFLLAGGFGVPPTQRQ